MSDSHFASNILKEHKLEIFLFVILGGVFTYFYSSILQEETAEPFDEPDYVLQAEQVQIEDYWGAQKRWKIFGQKAFIAKNNRMVVLEDVKILVYRPQPAPPSQVDVVVTAEQGIINWEEERVTLLSDVKMVRPPEMQIRAQKTIYHYQSGLLHIPDKVDMHYLQDSVVGEALTYDVLQKKMELQQARWMQ